MSNSFGLVLAVATAWLAIGVILSIVMGRRGHNGFGWLIVGGLLGPLGVVLAVNAKDHEEQLAPASLHTGPADPAGPGPVDVLVGYDGSQESVAAMDAVIELLGDRLGRLAVASVVPYGDGREHERKATEDLRHLAQQSSGRVADLEVLHGHPSVALREFAMAGGYDLIAIGTCGKGFAKTILGSAASELARDSKVPVLVVGGTGTT